MDAPIRYEKVLPFKQTVYEGNREKALVILALWRTKRTQKVFIFLLLAKNEMTGKMWIFSFAVDNFIFWKVGTASQFKLNVVFLEFKHTHRYFTSHYVEAKLLSTTYSKLSLEYHEGQLALGIFLFVTFTSCYVYYAPVFRKVVPSKGVLYKQVYYYNCRRY